MNKAIFNIFLLVVFTLALIVFGAEEKKKEYTSEEFLKIVQSPPGREAWAKMSGTTKHRRRGKDTEEASLYLGIRFTPNRTIAQIIIDDKEGYSVGQAYKATKSSTSIIPLHKAKGTESILGKFGLRPEDLTMTFLFWDYKKELKKDSVKGYDCRVFLLESPDKKEMVKVYISEEYFFPLKVEWFKNAKGFNIAAAKPYRTIEVKNFKNENDYWLVSRLDLFGPGWRTKVEFSDCEAGDFKKSPPKNLFKEFKK